MNEYKFPSRQTYVLLVDGEQAGELVFRVKSAFDDAREPRGTPLALIALPTASSLR